MTTEQHHHKPIYGTDLSKPLTQIIEELRRQMVQTRGQISDVQFGFPQWKERLEDVNGLFTCGISYLHRLNEEIRDWKIKCDDAEFGNSIQFAPRGIGCDAVPCCFVCAEPCRDYMANISGFVRSKSDGESIVTMFSSMARLDFRPSEPNWIQVKVGVCRKHRLNLEHLYEATRLYGVIRESQIKEARAISVSSEVTDKQEATAK